jgi:hypothetical protein
MLSAVAAQAQTVRWQAPGVNARDGGCHPRPPRLAPRCGARTVSSSAGNVMTAALRPLRRLALFLSLLGLYRPGADLLWAQRQAGPAFAATTVRLRRQPSADAPLLAVIPIGTAVEVQRCDSAWCRVQFRRQDGFVAEQFLSDSAPWVALTGAGAMSIRRGFGCPPQAARWTAVRLRGQARSAATGRSASASHVAVPVPITEVSSAGCRDELAT